LKLSSKYLGFNPFFLAFKSILVRKRDLSFEFLLSRQALSSHYLFLLHLVKFIFASVVFATTFFFYFFPSCFFLVFSFIVDILFFFKKTKSSWAYLEFNPFFSLLKSILVHEILFLLIFLHPDMLFSSHLVSWLTFSNFFVLHLFYFAIGIFLFFSSSSYWLL